MPVVYHEGKFPPRNVDVAFLAPKIEDATAAVSRYDSFLGLIPNPHILDSPLLIQEAVTSSKIEGTQATVGEVLEFEAGNTNVGPVLENDIREVVNYRNALKTATELLALLPISGRVLRAAHEVLLFEVRGKYNSPGMYRVDQNWIGTKNSSIDQARYVPIAPEYLEDAMARWEKFVNKEGSSRLLKIAIAHAEFESVHPFGDGNGRIGRMLIPLMLKQEGFIESPCFYVSEYFEQHDTEYREALLAVSRDDDWTGWCAFFLDAICAQGKLNYERARAIFQLNTTLKGELAEKSGSAYAPEVVDALFHSSIFSSRDLMKRCCHVQPQTVRRLLKCLCEIGCVNELSESRGRKAAIYVFPELLRITEGL